MNIQVHGAIETNNYGDILLAVLFCRKIKLLGHNVIVKGACQEFYNYMGNEVSQEGKADKVVFCGGGYLCDGNFRFTLHMIKTIFIKMAYFRMKKIPYCIIGAGTKEFKFNPTKKFIKWCIEGADKIFVRNEESKKDLQNIGVKKEIIVTADNVMAIEEKNISSKAIEKMKTNLKDLKKNNKQILLHLNYLNIDENKKFTEGAQILYRAIKKYSSSCDSTNFIICCDHKIQIFMEQCEELMKLLNEENTKVVVCENIDDMLALIFLSDGIITTKLHVGISAVALNKKVVAFPMHPKTMRFYKQIHESDRCKKIIELNDSREIINIINSSFNKEYDIQIIEKIKNKARQNYIYLEKFIGENGNE